MRNLAVLGSGSDVGKSVLAAALCRIFANRGVAVAPFKAQNMSNNAAVTADGLEMGRAQFVQAEAARAVPHVDMNPVLLKPTTDRSSQVVVLGQVLGDQDARTYFRDRQSLRDVAFAALDRLRARHELLVLEGAGSCAEVNLRPRDFVNFEAAHHCDADVLLAADIHKGGVFAQLVGTLEVLDDRDRARVRGLVVNRFRGDRSLFDDGVSWLERRTGLPVVGVVPWFRDIYIEPEDGLPPQVRVDPPIEGTPRVRIAVLRAPHIANFTDALPLARVPGVELHWLARPRDLSAYDAVILAGSKNTRGDLAWLRAGWWGELQAYRGHVLGICGGYQMLGEIVSDPDGLEGAPGDAEGLGLLRSHTRFAAPKVLTRTVGRLGTGEEVEGYEIHLGRTDTKERPWIRVSRRDRTPVDEPDGAVSPDGRVVGTYLHGWLDRPPARAAWLRRIKPGDDFADVAALPDPIADKDAQYEKLAAWVGGALDLGRVGHPG